MGGYILQFCITYIRIYPISRRLQEITERGLRIWIRKVSMSISFILSILFYVTILYVVIYIRMYYLSFISIIVSFMYVC